jgi:hypothetical protein
LKRWLLPFLDDILLVLGCVCILYGLSLWNIIITWIAAGLILIGLAVLIGRAKAQNVVK